MGEGNFLLRLFQSHVGKQESVLETEMWMGPCERGPHAQKCVLCTYPSGHPAPSRHRSEPRRGQDAWLPSAPVEKSSCLQLRFISASDSAGPAGSMTARHWGQNKKRLAVRSDPQGAPKGREEKSQGFPPHLPVPARQTTLRVLVHVKERTRSFQ